MKMHHLAKEVVFNFLSRLPEGYIIQLHCLVMDKEDSDTRVQCRYFVFS